jgi:hypothetical protein
MIVDFFSFFFLLFFLPRWGPIFLCVRQDSGDERAKKSYIYLIVCLAVVPFAIVPAFYSLRAPGHVKKKTMMTRRAKPFSTPQSLKFLLYKPHSSPNFLCHPADVKPPPLQEDRKTERTWRLCYPYEVKRSQ